MRLSNAAFSHTHRGHAAPSRLALARSHAAGACVALGHTLSFAQDAGPVLLSSSRTRRPAPLVRYSGLA